MTRMKLNIPRTLAVIVIAHTVVAVGYPMAMLLGCSEAPWAGTVADQQGSEAVDVHAFLLYTNRVRLTTVGYSTNVFQSDTVNVQ